MSSYIVCSPLLVHLFNFEDVCCYVSLCVCVCVREQMPLPLVTAFPYACELVAAYSGSYSALLFLCVLSLCCIKCSISVYTAGAACQIPSVSYL